MMSQLMKVSQSKVHSLDFQFWCLYFEGCTCVVLCVVTPDSFLFSSSTNERGQKKTLQSAFIFLRFSQKSILKMLIFRESKIRNNVEISLTRCVFRYDITSTVQLKTC